MTTIHDELLKASENAFREIQRQHRAEPRPTLYGRAGTMENRCVVCNRVAPCETWSTAQAQLDKLAA